MDEPENEHSDFFPLIFFQVKHCFVYHPFYCSSLNEWMLPISADNSVSVIYCYVTNYKKIIVLKQEQFYLHIILSVINLGSSWTQLGRFSSSLSWVIYLVVCLWWFTWELDCLKWPYSRERWLADSQPGVFCSIPNGLSRRPVQDHSSVVLLLQMESKASKLQCISTF